MDKIDCVYKVQNKMFCKQLYPNSCTGARVPPLAPAGIWTAPISESTGGGKTIPNAAEWLAQSRHTRESLNNAAKTPHARQQRTVCRYDLSSSGILSPSVRLRQRFRIRRKEDSALQEPVREGHSRQPFSSEVPVPMRLRKVWKHIVSHSGAHGGNLCNLVCREPNSEIVIVLYGTIPELTKGSLRS
jgi:hypothetical protein